MRSFGKDCGSGCSLAGLRCTSWTRNWMFRVLFILMMNFFD
jgi:hypothetical protein